MTISRSKLVLLPLLAAMMSAPTLAAEAPPSGLKISSLMSAGEVFDMCIDKPGDPEQDLRKLLCAGYLAGASDGFSVILGMGGGKPEYCLPKISAKGAIMDAFIAYMKVHPEKRDWPASGASLLANREHFPCTAK